ncbi:hypothetical protein [Azospirillum soli]|uniref:hypothetical protein n=1 Tax=Azospirillum soli TaxID=1304799 RepID=UPI001AE3338D|nr:hypothetical protein [Azospirillum soli]MBP2312621.1 hypothetical protein [Azospirillum soli]
MPQHVPPDVDDLGPYPPAECPKLAARPEGWGQLVITTSQRSIIGQAVRSAAAAAPGESGHRWVGNWPVWRLYLWFAPGHEKAMLAAAVVARLHSDDADDPPKIDPPVVEPAQ